jgi:cytochrome c oxidase subunit 2
VNPSLITTNQAVDPVFKFIYGASLLLLLGITATIVAFVIRYHRSRSPEPTSQTSDNIWLEIVWTVLPTLLVLTMFYFGWSGYLSLRKVPTNALKVTATGRMWSFSFAYANGKTSPKLYVPVGKPVLVNLVSQDVLHGFYLPAFRVKRDMVPGMKNYAWFVAERPGSYDLFCSVYCGTGHSAMITTVEALPPGQFDAWLSEKGGPENAGRELLEKHGCLGCHSLDGSRGVGPSFKGLYNNRVTVVQNGARLTLTADDAYLRESIRAPNAKVVEGYQPIMPVLSELKDEEVEALVEFIKNLK